MRISDWSSDVCSSDLAEMAAFHPLHRHRPGGRGDTALAIAQIARDIVIKAVPARLRRQHDRKGGIPGDIDRFQRVHLNRNTQAHGSLPDRAHHPLGECAANVTRARCRSEEHTSELQSLMRISYAVFCLKKKTNKPQ